MKEINLLPEEAKPKGTFLKLSKILEKIDIILFLIFLVAAISLAGGFWTLSNRRNDLQDTQEQLRSDIRALEETEQELVLIQDRLDKIQQVYDMESAKDELASVEEIVGSMSSDTRFRNADLSTADLSIDVVTRDSSSMAQFFASLIADGYKKIELSSFSAGTDGYSIGLSLAR